jgi:perosamine synthetase
MTSFSSRWGEEELAELAAALRQPSLFYWKGERTAAMGEAFRALYPFKYWFPCSSGSAAIHIAMAALRLQPGDEVIVPPVTDMGSVVGILYQQAVPVFADLDPRTYNLDPVAVERVVTPRTRAVLAVHLAGTPCNVSALKELAKKRGFRVVEDCAQAWGAIHRGKPVGLHGDFGCYSLNDYKHISCGDGGVVGTQDEELGPSLGKWGDKSYDRMAALANPAALRDVGDLAPNYRISELQSAVATVQLRKLPAIVARRVKIGNRLNEMLGDVPGILPPVVSPGDVSSFWFYFFRTQPERLTGSRNEFVAALKADGVPARAGYLERPLYRYRVFQNHNFFGGKWPARDFGLTTMDYREVKCPVAEAILADGVIINLSERMTDVEVEKIGGAVAVAARRFLK